MRVFRQALACSLILVFASAAMVQARGSGTDSSKAVSGYYGTNNASAAAAPTKTMNIVEVNNKYLFKKAKITIKVGTKLVWKNVTDAPHTATSTKAGVFDVQIPAGRSKGFVFKKAGTYKYICSIHPYMKATVVVTK